MHVSEAVRTSLAEIRAHKLRSALTLVDIVLGTTALVVMVSVISGLADAVEKGLADLGYDGVIIVVPNEAEDRIERQKQGFSRGLRWADGAVIEQGREVVGQFLVESVSLSLVGGLLGAVLGYGITLLAGTAFEDGRQP